MKNATYEKLVQDWKAKRIPKGEWNPEVLWAYKNTYEKNERLDFKDLVEEDKIPDLVKELRRGGNYRVHHFKCLGRPGKPPDHLAGGRC